MLNFSSKLGHQLGQRSHLIDLVLLRACKESLKQQRQHGLIQLYVHVKLAYKYNIEGDRNLLTEDLSPIDAGGAQYLFAARVL